MIVVAKWLLLALTSLPFVGVFGAVIIVLYERSRSELAYRIVHLELQITFCLSILLLLIFSGAMGSGMESVSSQVGTWLAILGPRAQRISWAWRADLLAASLIAASTGVAWLVIRSHPPRDDQLIQSRLFLTTVAAFHACAVGFILSASLPQMLFFWGAIPFASLMMLGLSSASDAAQFAMRRATLTSLLTDGFILMAVLMMGNNSGSLWIDEVVSAQGLSRLADPVPALPGLIGCLLVLGVLGRIGLFPCFGWHNGASEWPGRVWTMIYLCAFVPSAVWLLMRFEPLLLAAEASQSLLAGLGTLGAVLGVFVACGQDESRRAGAYLLSAQVGVIFVAISTGMMSSESISSWWAGDALRASRIVLMLITQGIVIAGAGVVWRNSRTPKQLQPQRVWWESFSQLSRQRLYIDKMTSVVVEIPLRLLTQSTRLMEEFIVGRFSPWMTDAVPSWLGRQIESLQIGHMSFSLAVMLLTVATLLLTFVLIA